MFKFRYKGGGEEEIIEKIIKMNFLDLKKVRKFGIERFY